MRLPFPIASGQHIAGGQLLQGFDIQATSESCQPGGRFQADKVATRKPGSRDNGQDSRFETGAGPIKPAVCFAAESTLGRLVKWLRLAGFDTVFEKGRPDAGKLQPHLDQGRIVLTRTSRIVHRLGPQRVLFVGQDQVALQFCQVAAKAGLSAGDLKPFCRCSFCNSLLVPADRRQVRALVPDYIWQTVAVFKGCPGCGRIYWPGSHTERALDRLETWMKQVCI